jgi:hypothetical protein
MTTVLFNDVVDNVGMQIYYYLWPRELLALGLCNHELWNKVISDKLLQICMYHVLPLRLGKTNYLADFHEASKFINRTELVEYVLDKTMDAGIVFDPYTTVEESQHWARDQLLQHRKKKLWHSLGIRMYGSGMAQSPRFIAKSYLRMPQL